MTASPGMMFRLLTFLAVLPRTACADRTNHVRGGSWAVDAPQKDDDSTVGAELSASNTFDAYARSVQKLAKEIANEIDVDAIRVQNSNEQISQVVDDYDGIVQNNESTAQRAATIYEHRDFRGASRDIYYDVDWMGHWWNEKLSSLIVYPNWCVVLFEHIYKAGERWKYCADDVPKRFPDLGAAQDDKTSSIAVIKS